jgi:signal transduction histidine kinase
MSDAAMTAALDNLIQNAVEAMPDGGRVTLDWTHDDDVAVVEVADDGPGLPDSVRSAFISGDRIGSTKVGGNGLGLLGVRSLLRRVGGDFELVRSTTGTVWHLTIPLDEEAVS